MPLSILPRSELTDLVLAEIRRHQGCEGVDSIVIQENAQVRSAANWEISIVAASSGDPATVQRVAAAVQKKLQSSYQLSGTRLRQFSAGDRVRLSELGRSRFPARQNADGTVVVEKRRTGGNGVRVLFDGSKTPVRLHDSFIEPSGPEQSETTTSKESSS